MVNYTAAYEESQWNRHSEFRYFMFITSKDNVYRVNVLINQFIKLFVTSSILLNMFNVLLNWGYYVKNV